MILGVPKETYPGERRVALVPEGVARLGPSGIECVVERGAGAAAGHPDSEYLTRGARVLEHRRELFAEADLIAQVRGVGANPDAGRGDLELFREGQISIALHEPLTRPTLMLELAATGATGLALELVPRIARAQSMDVLSSMATIAGYKAVLLAAERLPKMFPMMMTAAGTVAPAHVLVVGTGVAGLQAIATARRLGAVVQAYDIRPAAREQVESLGARFVDLQLEVLESEDSGGYARDLSAELRQAQRERLARVVADSDVVVATAAVPGKPAPLLLSDGMLADMRPGSVVVDLAAERGGNCELTRKDETVRRHGVEVLGPTNLPATVPYHASQMYSRNVVTLLQHVVSDGQLSLDETDEIVRDLLVVSSHQVVHPRVSEQIAPLPGEEAS